MGKRKKVKRWTGKQTARSKAIAPPAGPALRRGRECAPALLALAWLAAVGMLDYRQETAPPVRRSWKFSLHGSAAASLASVHARDATVRHDSTPEVIFVSGVPRLLPVRYHGTEPGDRDKPARDWGFTWALHHDGGQLIMEALGETRTAQLRYFLDDLEIRVPPGYDLRLTAPAPPPAAH